jgi:hypothetical protein
MRTWNVIANASDWECLGEFCFPLCILLRADRCIARADLMAWYEASGVHFVFGLAKNDRSIAAIKGELEAAEKTSQRTG